jgi:hypothetical protein
MKKAIYRVAKTSPGINWVGLICGLGKQTKLHLDSI